MSKFSTIAVHKEDLDLFDELVRRDPGKPSRAVVVRRLIHQEIERLNALDAWKAKHPGPPSRDVHPAPWERVVE